MSSHHHFRIGITFARWLNVQRICNGKLCEGERILGAGELLQAAVVRHVPIQLSKAIS